MLLFVYVSIFSLQSWLLILTNCCKTWFLISATWKSCAPRAVLRLGLHITTDLFFWSYNSSCIIISLMVSNISISRWLLLFAILLIRYVFSLEFLLNLYLEYSSYLFRSAGDRFSCVWFHCWFCWFWNICWFCCIFRFMVHGSAVDFVMNGVCSSCRYPQALFFSFNLY